MSVQLGLPVLIGLIIVALTFDFLNGLHDTANSIATLVSTRMLRPRYAVIWAAFFNFIAFLVFGVHVARTVGVGIVSAEVIDAQVIFGALIGAIFWNVITWWAGIPSSSSHALIGGLVGAGVAKAGLSSIVWPGLLTTGAFIVLSPLLGFFIALLLVLSVSWGFKRANPTTVEPTFQWLQFGAASLISLGHGGNDAQKTMGIIAVLLFSQGHLGGDFYVPFWVVITCQAAIGLGTLVGGWRIVHTVGSKITRMTPVPGLLRIRRRRHHAVCRHLPRHTGIDHAHSYWRDHRRRRRKESIRRALEYRRQYRHRLDHYAACDGACGGIMLFIVPAFRLKLGTWRRHALLVCRERPATKCGIRVSSCLR